MTPPELSALARERVLLLDGGMGTLLIGMGLEPGRAPEWWNLEHPEHVAAAHGRYVDAGSDFIHTNTFGGSPPKLAASGLGGRSAEVNAAAVRIAREAAGGRARVAGDVGPTGLSLPPVGSASVEQMDKAFREQIEALAAAGVDLISIETMYDLREALAAVRAARDSGLAVLGSMTFEQRRRGAFTVMGDPLVASLRAMLDAGATAVGLNCSVTSEVAAGMIAQAATELGGAPLVAQPNAGQPKVTADGIHYDADPGRFAADLERMARSGARVLGGCCGTDETFIRAARSTLAAARDGDAVSSGGTVRG
jgi:5-methyltetrahydrofolate--homocysteine methyltransferase